MTAVVLDGIVLGLAFGLLGVGMTLVYGLGGVINLAYGQIVVVGAIVTSLVIEDGVPRRSPPPWACWRQPACPSCSTSRCCDRSTASTARSGSSWASC